MKRLFEAPMRWFRVVKIAMHLDWFKSQMKQLSLVLLTACLLVQIAFRAEGQTQDITCQAGRGEYTFQFSSGTTVSVGPVRNGGFAERACAASLTWKGNELPIATDVDQVGIDVLGADLGFGKPVVAIQVDQSGAGSNRAYQIYSLLKPPHLLYTIKGAHSYRAADTDLDGHIEIWADDAAAVDGFERLPVADLDSPPTVVLRFEKGRLFDVSSQFLAFYDAQITRLRSQFTADDLSRFKRSDGKLSVDIHQSAEELHRLIRTKISILEIIWAYLYSGREQQAWSSLNELWPAEDVERIRAAISATHQRGILSGVDQTRHPAPRKHFMKIYDAVDTAVIVSSYNPAGGAPDSSQAEPPVIQPKSILLRRPPSSPDGPGPPTNEMVELVVDVAGKVHSAKIINGSDKPLIEATAGWHFIPAFRDGRPVACRFRISVGAYK